MPLVVAVLVPHDVARINIPMAAMYAGVVAATLVGGALTGVLAGLVSVGTLAYWYIPPCDSVEMGSDTDMVSLLVFAVVSVAMIALVTVLVERASMQAELRGRAEAEARVEHEMIDAIQQALLPRSTLVIDGADIAARYIGASRADLMGGDWYLVVQLDAERIALGVGDVTGHGINAAAVMAELRFAMRAYAYTDPTPSEVLRRLNELHCASHEETLASALFGVLDLRTQRWVQASAGHCPPILVSADGAVTFEHSPHAPMFGIDVDARYTDHRFDVPAGSVLVMYTDGLIERRSEPIDGGISRLANAVTTAATAEPDLSQLCDTVLAAMDNQDIDDDIVILAFRQRKQI